MTQQIFVTTFVVLSSILSIAQAQAPASSSLLRIEAWTEDWPGADGKTEQRNVTGEIWNQSIQDMLARHNFAHLPQRDEPYYLDGPLILKSGQRIFADPKAEIRLKPGCNTCMVRNERIVGFADSPVPDGLQADSDITIEGGIWTTLANGTKNDNGNRLGRSSKQSHVYGTHGVILLQNVTRLTIKNVTIRQSKAFGVHLGNVHQFVVDGVKLDRHQRDGIHVSGPASNGVIRKVSGDSHDDNVSLTAWDWKNCAPSFGAIHHVTIEHVTGSPLEKHAADAIRLLPGVKQFSDGTLLDCPIHDIVLRDITDIRDFKLYDQPNLELGRDKDASAGVGTLQNICFEKLIFNRPGCLQVHANTDGLTVREVLLKFPLVADFHLIELGPKSQVYKHNADDPSTWVEIFSPDLDCSIRNLTVSDVRSEGSIDELPTENLIRVIEQSVNSNYPKTIPRGGTGRAFLIP